MATLRPKPWENSTLGELYIGIWRVQCSLEETIFHVSPCLAGPATHPHLSRRPVSHGHRWRSTSFTLVRVSMSVVSNPLAYDAMCQGLTGGSLARDPSSDDENKEIAGQIPKKTTSRENNKMDCVFSMYILSYLSM